MRMATAISDLREWLRQGQSKGASHMIVVCDKVDWVDSPIYVMPTQVVREVYHQCQAEPDQRVMEVYNLSKDFETQLNEYRAMEF